jgi:hypothetical protein
MVRIRFGFEIVKLDLTELSRLHRPAYEVTFDIENTGSRYGSEVCLHQIHRGTVSDGACLLIKIPQVYLNMPASSGEPPAVLRGFTHIELNPGETQPVKITLSRHHLSIWDVVKQGWRRPEGIIGVTVGASSRDCRLRGRVP